MAWELLVGSKGAERWAVITEYVGFTSATFRDSAFIHRFMFYLTLTVHWGCVCEDWI